jgi:uncharacterized protein YxjI
MFRGAGMRRGAAVAAPPAAPAAAPAAAPTAAQDSGAEDLGNRFRVRERMVAFGDDFYVEDARGQRVFWIDGKAMRLRDTLLFKDMQGTERYKIQEKVARVRESMTLYNADGSPAAQIHKAMITPLRDRYSINVPGKGDLETQGNILHHEYTIELNRMPVAQITKRWFRIRDTYGIQVMPGTIDPLLAIAMAVCIDMMNEPG